MLCDLQRRFAATVIGGGTEAAAALVVDDAPGAAARLAIYANHYRVTLIDALASTFPVVFKLVGEPFFRAAARRYVLAFPPQQPCLFEYGDGFPAFLGALPEAASVPYLADCARLDWAVNAAWHAAEPPADTPLALHPSLALVTSPFPIDRIWRANQEPALDELSAIDLDAGGVRLLVNRQGKDVGWIPLLEPDATFAGALLAGEGIGAALAAAARPGYDPTLLLAALLDAGLVVAPFA